MAKAETVTQFETRVVEVEVEKTVLTLDKQEAEVVAALVQSLDSATCDHLGLWSLKDTLNGTVGQQRYVYNVRENSLGYLRVTKTAGGDKAEEG